MSDAQDRIAALARLNDLAEPDTNPKLSPDEISAILDNHQVAITWAPGIVIKSSLLVAPTVGNGRWYRPRISGLSGPTEPGWPVGTSSRPILDGAATYEDAGEALDSVYDVQAAAWEAWDKKARKASKYPKMSGIDVSSIYDHCKEMRDSFAPVLCA